MKKFSDDACQKENYSNTNIDKKAFILAFGEFVKGGDKHEKDQESDHNLYIKG